MNVTVREWLAIPFQSRWLKLVKESERQRMELQKKKAR